MSKVIKGLTFVMTCGGFPEQYDVFDENGNPAGYVRLRHGGLRCHYPNSDIFSECIYYAETTMVILLVMENSLQKN